MKIKTTLLVLALTATIAVQAGTVYRTPIETLKLALSTKSIDRSNRLFLSAMSNKKIFSGHKKYTHGISFWEFRTMTAKLTRDGKKNCITCGQNQRTRNLVFKLLGKTVYNGNYSLIPTGFKL